MAVDLKLYNSLTRSKQIFTPIDPQNVRLYVCGPTVYDFAHIGNARPVIVFDVLFRLLRHICGVENTVYARNITDVDDKINARALRDFPSLPLNEAIANVTTKTTQQFHQDVQSLGCLPPSHEPRATEHIDGMIALINQLLARNHAYIASTHDGFEVLFDVSSMPDYGQLSKRNLDEQQAGARVSIEAHKRQAMDFVLWKHSATDQPGWRASFEDNGVTREIYGRPGWHIECSAMSKAFLGETFDIHGGGLDLMFPHHENEIAQSCCANNTKILANIWMHNGFVQVNGRKMSKSEGNFLTIHELLHTKNFGNRSWDGRVLRLAMLMTHYREPIDFTAHRLIEAENILKKWAAYSLQIRPNETLSDFIDASLLDDLNTAQTIAAMSSLGKSGANGNSSDGLKFTALCGLLGFENISDFAGQTRTIDDALRARIEDAIRTREVFLKEKNFKEADLIRAELLLQNVHLKDSKDPNTGERITKYEIKSS